MHAFTKLAVSTNYNELNAKLIGFNIAKFDDIYEI